VETPLLCPEVPDLILDPQGRPHPLILQHGLKLAVWTVSSDPLTRREFQTKQRSLFVHLGGKGPRSPLLSMEEKDLLVRDANPLSAL
jgi:hypothetical protein